ncbi:MAG: hypothetical protein AAFY76_21695 [Cyanobacteria bacterium J06649_11]
MWLMFLISCGTPKSENSLDLTSGQIEFVRDALIHVIENSEEFSSLALDSFQLCDAFDLFSRDRIPDDLQLDITFDDQLENEINDAFFNKTSASLSSLTKRTNGLRRLSISGFNEEWIFVCYSEFGTSDTNICQSESNAQQTFVLQRAQNEFSIVASSLVSFH